MARIRILSDQVANQIAAGEVIERPAAVVKELVENALDAGATRIEVEFRHGGKSHLRVEDNGAGMSGDDALLALERHATSKLVEARDLDHIGTFGFRGEALPSIASVTRFTLQTRARGQDEGVEIFVDGGVLKHKHEHGMAPGTRILADHIFNSVPARRKFMRTDATESSHIVQCVRLYATANPSVAFRLLEDGREIFSSPKDSTLIDRVAAIWGARLKNELIALRGAQDGDLKLSGLLGKPGVARAGKSETVIFVNGRPVDCRALTYALLEGYHGRLPKGAYPPAFLFFEADPARIDVNVHPAKREIRLKDEFRIRNFITNAVATALGGAPRAPDAAQGISLRPQIPAYEIHAPAAVLSEPPPSLAAPKTNAPGWRLIGLWRAPVWLFETPGGLVLFNARAAHRRILYEALLKGKASADAAQPLLIPLSLEFSALESAALNEGAPLFAKQGFSLESFGGHCWRVDALPAWLDPDEAEPFLREAVELLREQGKLRDAQAREQALAKLAAKAAVRRDDMASEADVTALAAQLAACDNPLTAPDGKPTYIELSTGDLQRRFM